MNKKNTELLLKDFPKLFKADDDSKSSFNMFYFECGDGWYDIIREGCLKLEPLIEKCIKENPQEERYDHPRASQVKEKYSSLRFYMTSETEEMSNIIRAMEDKSEATCETCGQPGKTRGKGWLYTACDEHVRD